MYTIGQEITTIYTDAPVDNPYEIGTIVSIQDTETEEVLAKFSVTETDDTTIHGVIVEVKERWIKNNT